jgi:hypothetical protein
MISLLTAAPLKGYRTYTLAALGVLTALAQWAVGDASAADTVHAVWQALLSLSVATARAALDA